MHLISKADFHGTLANRGRLRAQHDHRPGFDLSICYRKGSARVRTLTISGRHFMAPYGVMRDFGHAAAYMLSLNAKGQGLRVLTIGEPALASVAKAETILRLEVAA